MRRGPKNEKKYKVGLEKVFCLFKTRYFFNNYCF